MVGQSIDDLVAPGKLRCTAMHDVLPGRHVLLLHDKDGGAATTDYAFLSLDAGGRVLAWYEGAKRIYGYKSEEIIGQDASCLCLEDVDFEGELKRTALDGHLGAEGWHKRQNGSRFWANSLTTALRDGNEELRVLCEWCGTLARGTLLANNGLQENSQPNPP